MPDSADKWKHCGDRSVLELGSAKANEREKDRGREISKGMLNPEIIIIYNDIDAIENR